MDDAALVCLGERRTNAQRHRHGVAQAEWSAADALGQVLALDPLHGQVGLVCLVDSVRHVGDDVGVVQFGQDLGLARKALNILRRAVRLEKLERNRSPELLIDRAKDRADAAARDLVLDQKTLREQLTGDGMAHAPWEGYHRRGPDR
jgi:hypothetical protein